jgi:hypothetical protein
MQALEINLVYRYNYRGKLVGNGQAVRHWVLVPGSGVRIPLPQPYKMTARRGGYFVLLGVARTTGGCISRRNGGSVEGVRAQKATSSMGEWNRA